MLKQLRINIRLEKARRDLAALLDKRADFDARRAALEARMAEAANLTDEELAEVETSLAALESETEAANLDEQIEAAERSIEALENDLNEIDEPAQNPPARRSDPEGGDFMNRTAIPGLTVRARLEALTERAEFKEWTAQIRSLAGTQTRAVSGEDVLIPHIILDPLRQVIAENSKLLKYVNRKYVKGTARQPIVGAVPEPVWMEMKGALNELNIVFNAVEVDGYKVGGYVPVPNSVLQDTDINLASEIVSLLGKSIAYGVDKAIMYGVGVKMPLGIIPRLGSATAPRDFGAGAPAYTDLTSSHIGYLSSSSLTPTAWYAEVFTGLAKAEDRYGAGGKFWAMNSKTKSAIQAKLLNINAAGAMVTGASDVMPVVGGEIVLLDGIMPDNVIAGGYGGLYTLSEREGTSISKSEHVHFIADNTVFKGVARYDGMPVIGEGFAMFTIATSSGATSADFAEDVAGTADAWLTALNVKNGDNTVTLTPTFDKDTLSYTASVANAVSSVNVTATARTRGKVGAIKVGGTAAGTGGACSLETGANTITVEAIYGSSKRTYTVVVTRAAS